MYIDRHSKRQSGGVILGFVKREKEFIASLIESSRGFIITVFVSEVIQYFEGDSGFEILR